MNVSAFWSLLFGFLVFIENIAAVMIWKACYCDENSSAEEKKVTCHNFVIV
jgi:hypothetical protein